MRLFVGIEFPPHIVSVLTDCQKGLRECAERGRFKYPENFHLTLKFLGEVSADTVEDVISPFPGIAFKVQPFSLRLSRVGQFGDGNFARVVWMGVTGEVQRLNELQLQVQQALTVKGFKPDNRPWRPHITLAQDVVWTGNKLAECFGSSAAVFEVGEFALILSEERDRRRIYTPIYRFPLGKAMIKPGGKDS